MLLSVFQSSNYQIIWIILNPKSCREEEEAPKNLGLIGHESFSVGFIRRQLALQLVRL